MFCLLLLNILISSKTSPHGFLRFNFDTPAASWDVTNALSPDSVEHQDIQLWGSRVQLLSQHEREAYYTIFYWEGYVRKGVCVCACTCVLRCVEFFEASWTATSQAYLSIGLSLVRILDWFAISYSRASSWPRDQIRISCISCTGRWILYHQRHLGSPYKKVNDHYKTEYLFAT